MTATASSKRCTGATSKCCACVSVEGLERADNQRSAVAEALLAHFEVAANDPAGYRYASGDPPFPRLAELEDERVTQVAELLGGGTEACLIARALLSTVHAAVLHQLDHSELKRRRATELMAAFLTGAAAGRRRARVAHAAATRQLIQRPV